MMDPSPAFLLESWVIIDKAQVTNTLSSFIDLIKIPNLHMMDVLIKIDWMMADAVRKCYTAVSLVLAETGQSEAPRR